MKSYFWKRREANRTSGASGGNLHIGAKGQQVKLLKALAEHCAAQDAEASEIYVERLEPADTNNDCVNAKRGIHHGFRSHLDCGEAVGELARGEVASVELTGCDLP